MTKLSVNINKIATLRNSRGADVPNLIQVAKDCEKFGAQGITIHPRPDERHIKYSDVYDLKKIVTTEFNIEGNPEEGRFQEIVLENKPDQVTLVPDKLGAITSNAGWDTISNQKKLIKIIEKYKEAGIRVSLFVDPIPNMIIGAKDCGTDRVELYTETYASNFSINKEVAIQPFLLAAETAEKMKLGLNAGHDLNLENLHFFAKNIPNLLEVSIGHALISDALYLGLEETINQYLLALV